MTEWACVQPKGGGYIRCWWVPPLNGAENVANVHAYQRGPRGMKLIHSPHLLVRATGERFLPTGGTFRAILANESHRLQPVLVPSVHWWPAPAGVRSVQVFSLNKHFSCWGRWTNTHEIAHHESKYLVWKSNFLHLHGIVSTYFFGIFPVPPKPPVKLNNVMPPNINS